METAEIARVERALKGAAGKRMLEAVEAETAAPERLGSAASRRKADRLLSRLMAKSGIAAEFETVLKEDAERLAVKLDKARTAATKRLEAGSRALEAQRASLAASMGALAELTVAGAEKFVLNAPFLIWPSNSVDLEFSEIVELNSTAKFRTGSVRNFSGEVAFWYLWQNPRNAFAVIDIDAFAIFKGIVTVGSGGGNFPGDRRASASVRARLTPFEWWNQPATIPPFQADNLAQIASLSVDTSGWFEVGAIDLRDIFRGVALRHAQMVVPPSGVVVLTVSAQVSSQAGSGGNASFDFANGSFHVGSPAVIVTLVS